MGGNYKASHLKKTTMHADLAKQARNARRAEKAGRERETRALVTSMSNV
jgi:hypothetical protein